MATNLAIDPELLERAVLLVILVRRTRGSPSS